MLGFLAVDFVFRFVFGGWCSDVCVFACLCRYYSGEKKAPILTIFIGGNHEASNYLQELPYGGWVAPNIYYLGKNTPSPVPLGCAP